MNEKNRVKIKICDRNFILKSDESHEYMLRISKLVNNRVSEAVNLLSNVSVEMASILTALNFCDELEKEKMVNMKIAKQYKSLLDELEECKKENKELISNNNQSKEVIRLEEEKKALHERIEFLKNKVDFYESQPVLTQSPQKEAIQAPLNVTKNVVSKKAERKANARLTANYTDFESKTKEQKKKNKN